MLSNIDFAILNFIRENFTCVFLDFWMPKITLLGSGGIIWILFAVIMLCQKKYRRGGIVLLIGLAIGAVLGNLIIKPIVSRPRPYELNEAVKILIGPPHGSSFPSGHTIASSTAAYIITYFNKKAGYIAVPIAILIIFSRMYLYVHFPSDIIGGLFVGLLTAYLTIKVFKRKNFI